MEQQQQEVLELVEVLYTMVSEAWGVPLGNEKCIIERDKALGILDEIKAQLPVELSEARRLVMGRDEFIGNARREAESVHRAAEEHARRMVEEQEVVRVAKARTAEVYAEADVKTRELKRAANEYVDDALRRTEEAVNAALDEIRQSRVRFRSASVNPAPVSQQQPDMESIQPEDF